MASLNGGGTAVRPWEEFAAEVAAILNTSSEAIHPDAYLVEDLGADSVALAEIIAFLILDCGMEALTDDLDQRDWRAVTAGQVYREYSEARPDS